MDMIIGIVIGLVLGGGAGYFFSGGGKTVVRDKEATEWWRLRETLTGTQLQILQFMESRRSASIESLQEKFSFIPDRELFYRLEQICLMGFMGHDRIDGVMSYSLNSEYSSTVEDDKTVMVKGDN